MEAWCTCLRPGSDTVDASQEGHLGSELCGRWWSRLGGWKIGHKDTDEKAGTDFTASEGVKKGMAQPVERGRRRARG